METISAFARWCNRNEGFFSLVVSMIAVVISITAIREQNKGALLERRSAVFRKTYTIYRKLSRIKKISNTKGINVNRYNISLVLFDIGSEESKIFQELRKIEQEHENKKLVLAEDINRSENNRTKNFLSNDRASALLDQFAEIFIEKYTLDFWVEEARLFYGNQIAECIQELCSVYEDLVLSLGVLTQSELQLQLQTIIAVLQVFDENRVLKKMRKGLLR